LIHGQQRAHTNKELSKTISDPRNKIVFVQALSTSTYVYKEKWAMFEMFLLIQNKLKVAEKRVLYNIKGKT
jgi:hypothetical protein